MRRLLLSVLFALLVGIGSAQQRDTVYDHVLTDNQSDPALATLGASKNIGQIQHMWTVIFDDAPTKTCSNIGEPEFLPQGAYEPTFSPFITEAAKVQVIDAGSGNIRIVTITAAGAYPYNRLQVQSYDEVNCKINVFYSGTVNPISDYNQGLGIGNSSNIYTLLESPIVITDSNIFTIPSGGKGISIVVYGLTLYNSGASSTVRLGFTTATPDTFAKLRLDAFCDSCGMVWPVTGHAYTKIAAGEALEIETTSATGATLSGQIIYRFE